MVRKTPKPKTKACSKCGKRRHLKSFYPKISGRLGTTAQCKKCINAAQREEYKENPTRRDWRAVTLKHLYGITIEQYDAMFKAQEGVCAICKRPPKKRRLAVDHDHKTGRIRGLLCWYCNRALGYLRDNKEVTKAAARYLARKKALGLV